MLTADTALATMMAVWLAAELGMLVWLRPTGQGDERRDQGTLRLVVLVIAGALAAAGLCAWQGVAAFPDDWTVPVRWSGVALMAVGVAIRWAAVLTLRRYFTVAVAIRPGHKLVDWGLYRFVRHPSYTGAIVALVGLGLASGGWLSALLIVVPIVFAVLRRIRVEEQALAEAFGAPYQNWCARTPMLVPRWPR